MQTSKGIVDRSYLANTVPGLVFTGFFLLAAWIVCARRDVWWLALVVLFVGASLALITWRKLGWRPERHE